MGNPAGMRRNFTALEQRRIEAARLLREGLSQSEVARTVGVHRQSVNRWSRELAQSGVRGLRKAKRIGRPPKLSPAQLRDVERALKRGPEAFGFATGLWTASRVRELIASRIGVRYHEDHVWRILRQLNWTCQRPTGKALERDEAAIRHWQQSRWPELKKSAPGTAHHRLHRRQRIERATLSRTHLGGTGTDSGAAIPLHLEAALGRRRYDLVELLFPALSRDHPRSSGGGFSWSPAPSPTWQTTDSVGSPVAA